MAEPFRQHSSAARPPADVASSAPISRGTILTQLVDVFALREHHSPTEIAQFEEIAGALAEQAEPSACAQAARALIDHADAPIELLERFARLSDEAAVVVLGSSRAVSPARLAAAVAWGPAPIAASVAGRVDLEPHLVTALAMRPEREIALTLAANLHAPLSRQDLRALTLRARDDAVLATALLRRMEGEEAAPLLLHADELQRAGVIASALRRDLTQPPRIGARAPEPADIAALERAAVRSDLEACAQSLAKALDARPEVATRILDDKGGEILALAVAALNLTDVTRERILVFLAPGWGQEFRRFEKLRKLAAMCPPSTARRLIDALSERKRPIAAERAASEMRSGASSAHGAVQSSGCAAAGGG
jgi:uncharacterized protein (DUF2336 family)